jgi:hypothetical protein
VGHSDADWQIYLEQHRAYQKELASLPSDRLVIDAAGPLNDVTAAVSDRLVAMDAEGAD